MFGSSVCNTLILTTMKSELTELKARDASFPKVKKMEHKINLTNRKLERSIFVMQIIQITNDEDKKRITRNILEALPEWFGIPEAREEYIHDSTGKAFFCAVENEKDLGFLYLRETGKDTVELAVMGVLKEYHRKGIGKQLFIHAKKTAKEMGYSFIQVKTVQMGKYESYDDTNRFYISIGFKEFEVFSTLWDEWNPCQIYVMGI